MDWLEVTVTTSPEAVEAVAAKFQALGSAGVVLRDPSLAGRRRRESPLDFFPDDLTVPETDGVTGYWPAGAETEERLGELRRFLAELPSYGLDPGAGQVEVRHRAETEWADAWKRYYHALRIGRVVVCPSWEECQPDPGSVVVALDPGMAFGTGDHPTTALCLEALQELLVGGDQVVDVGTGSGILAIASAKLGAAHVLAVDVDPVACRVAGENVVGNGVAEQVEVRLGDAGEVLREVGPGVDLLLANLIADVIIPLAQTFAGALAPSGRLLASGVTAERRVEVTSALEQAGLSVARVRESKGWVAVEAALAP